jgi:superfamily II DNA or RNA helicase
MIEAIIYGNHWKIPRAWADEELIEADLTFVDANAVKQAELNPPRKGEKPVDPNVCVAYIETVNGKDYVFLPRGVEVSRYLRKGITPRFDVEGWGNEEVLEDWPTPQREMRSHQAEPFQALVDWEDPDQLLCLGCGRGKTTLALLYAARLKLKTLVVVDRDAILDQWKREIGAIFGEETAKATGTVQGKKDTIGEHLTVAMVQTLAARNRDGQLTDEWCSQFGLVIFDEAHVLGAPGFSLVPPRFPARRLALTATPERLDDLHPVYMLHTGGMQPSYVNIDRHQSSTWYFRSIGNILANGVEERCYRTVKAYGGRPARKMLLRPRYDTFASKSPIWNERILKDVLSATKAGRQVFVLGCRTGQLSFLHEELLKQGVDAGLIIGNVTKKERLEALKHQVLLVTDKIGYKALDVERLDCLFLLWPSKDEGFLRQAVGRIERVVEGKAAPIVVVYNHNATSSLRRMGEAMKLAIRNIDPNATLNY